MLMLEEILPNLYPSCIASLLGQPFHNVVTKTRSRSAFFKFHTMLSLEEMLFLLFVYLIYIRAGLLGQPFLNVANSTMRS